MMAHHRLRDVPSARTPGIRAGSNLADLIEEYLREDQEQKWGFVVYRCTYSNNSAWEAFMACLHGHVRKSLAFYNGLDMLDSLDMTVFEDAETLDGASTSTVREKFREWSAHAPEWGPSQRYTYCTYCIHVDDACMRSVSEDLREDPEGFVNLVWKRWVPDEPEEPGYEPLEGCTLKDVGWMRVAHRFILGEYCYLRRDDIWDTEYRRPPAIAER